MAQVSRPQPGGRRRKFLVVLCVSLLAAVALFVGMYAVNAIGGFLCSSVLAPASVSGSHQLPVPTPCYIDSNNHCPGVIDDIFPYTASGHTHSEDVLFSQDGSFFIESNGSSHALQLPDACLYGVVALTPDGDALACIGGVFGCVDCGTVCTSCFGAAIALAPLTPTLIGRTYPLVPIQQNARFTLPTWSPDERHLAALRRTFNGTTVQCSLAIYSTRQTVLPPTEPFTLTGLVSFSDDSLCRADQLLWSPDGSRIALLQNGYSDVGALYILPVKALPLALFAAHGATAQPATVTMRIAPYRLLTLPEVGDDFTQAATTIAWEPKGHLLTMSDDYGYRIIVIDPATKQARLLFTVPRPSSTSSPIKNLGWMADGIHLVFAVGYNETEYCGSPRDEMYIIALPSPFQSLPRVTPTTAPPPTATPALPTQTPAPTFPPTPTPPSAALNDSG